MIVANGVSRPPREISNATIHPSRCRETAVRWEQALIRAIHTHVQRGTQLTVEIIKSLSVAAPARSRSGMRSKRQRSQIIICDSNGTTQSSRERWRIGPQQHLWSSPPLLGWPATIQPAGGARSVEVVPSAVGELSAVLRIGADACGRQGWRRATALFRHFARAELIWSRA